MQTDVSDNRLIDTLLYLYKHTFDGSEYILTAYGRINAPKIRYNMVYIYVNKHSGNS